VIRLSKQYLPGLAVGFEHSKVKVHVGDGFKFLDDYKNEFDVIITDSSDPDGPAESLFQKPYFELLFGALKEGGVITTQGQNFLPSNLILFSTKQTTKFHNSSISDSLPLNENLLYLLSSISIILLCLC
jgi:spermidine synthase